VDVDSVLPLPEGDEGAADGDAEGGNPAASKANAPTGERQDPLAIILPFVQTPQAAPGPQTALTVEADEVTPSVLAETNGQPVQGQPVGRRACGTGGEQGKGGEQPAAPKAPEEAPSPELEAAVKQLLQQQKHLFGRHVAAAPRDGQAETAKTDAAAPQAQAPVPAQPQAPASIQTIAMQPTAELPQPALSPNATQPLPAAGDKLATVEGTRTTDLALERKLDLVRDTEWLDRLARDIAQAGSRDTPLRFRLHPQTLGHLQVELQQGDHGTAVRLTVETEAARQILADAQPRLAAEARAQGVRIAETHVDLSGSGRHAPGDQRRQDEARQTPLIRTARGADGDAAASPRASARARLDRYA
jgi:flagellar hook-length control protein FliK